MPKKKDPLETEDYVIETKEIGNYTEHSITKKEKLIPIRAFAGFSDGNLREAMEKYGYPCEWPRGEVRNLPRWLIQRCLSSGAELEQPE